MKIFLKLKHWQLFGIIWVIPFLLNIYTFTNPILSIIVFPAVVLIFSFGTFGWIWSIAVLLNPKLPKGASQNIRSFQILFSIPLLYIVFILIFIGMTFGEGLADLENINPKKAAWIIIPLHFLSLVLILWGVRFAAKTVRSIELGRMAKFSDYMGDIFLIWFSMIGFWILQPRLNKLSEDS